jgi:TRAP-type C4-dicarboxylate transport system permease small subunit
MRASAARFHDQQNTIGGEMSGRDHAEWLTLRIGGAASWLYLAVVAITAWEVGMRYLFNAPTLWVHELSVALAATCFVIGGPFVHQQRRHIAISFLYDRMPPARKRWARLAGSLLALFFCGFLAWAAGVQSLLALKVMETTGTATNWPIPAYLKTLFAICAGLMALQSLLHIVRDVRAIRSRAEDPQ